MMPTDAAHSLLEKLRIFISTELTDDERALMAALIAPGVARAYDTDEVEAYGVSTWSPDALPDALVAALREEGVRVEGLGF